MNQIHLGKKKTKTSPYSNVVPKNRKEDKWLLHHAAAEGKLNTIQKLIQNGASVDQKDNIGELSTLFCISIKKSWCVKSIFLKRYDNI